MTQILALAVVHLSEVSVAEGDWDDKADRPS